jgi:hypothetical protein
MSGIAVAYIAIGVGVARVFENDLVLHVLEEVARVRTHSLDGSRSLRRRGADGRDDNLLRGRLRLNVVPVVVGGVAEGVVRLAAGDGLTGRLGEHLLDAVEVGNRIGVTNAGDDRRDVEVGDAVPAVHADLSQHAGNVVLALSDGVEVALPSIGEGDSDGGPRRQDGRGDLGMAGVAGEVDRAVGVVLRHELDTGGCSGRSKHGSCGSKLDELHFERSKVVDLGLKDNGGMLSLMS